MISCWTERSIGFDVGIRSDGLNPYTYKRELETDAITLYGLFRVYERSFVKLDIQGAALLILEHAQRVLARHPIVQFDGSSLEMYRGQPSMIKLGAWLEAKGFHFHIVSKETHIPFGFRNRERVGVEVNQVLAYDLGFVPGLEAIRQISAAAVKARAFIAHSVYQSSDLAALWLQELDRRDGTDLFGDFRTYLEEATVDA